MGSRGPRLESFTVIPMPRRTVSEGLLHRSAWGEKSFSYGATGERELIASRHRHTASPDPGRFGQDLEEFRQRCCRPGPDASLEWSCGASDNIVASAVSREGHGGSVSALDYGV